MTPAENVNVPAENTMTMVWTFEASATVTKAADVQPDTEPTEE